MLDLKVIWYFILRTTQCRNKSPSLLKAVRVKINRADFTETNFSHPWKEKVIILPIMI